MSSIFDELRGIRVRKLVKTEIEYECDNEKKQEEVFDTVRDILADQLDSFSKITYDIDPATKKVKVEVTQHA